MHTIDRFMKPKGFASNGVNVEDCKMLKSRTFFFCGQQSPQVSESRPVQEPPNSIITMHTETIKLH